MRLHFDMTRAQSRAAFEEFVAERGPALTRLRDVMAADGLDPARMLDGSVESLVPLWQWVVSHLTGREDPGATDPASVPREVWPSWERYTWEEERTLSLESLVLLDGLVSYLAEVVMARVPAARWDIVHHKIKRYVVNNHPMLTVGPCAVHAFLPGYPCVQARRTLRGTERSADDAMAGHAKRLIGQLVAAQVPVVADPQVEAEPEVEVEDIRAEGWDYDFEVSLGEEIAHDRSDEVEELVEVLAREQGVEQVVREDREVIFVDAPSWSAEQVHAWFTVRL